MPCRLSPEDDWDFDEPEPCHTCEGDSEVVDDLDMEHTARAARKPTPIAGSPASTPAITSGTNGKVRRHQTVKTAPVGRPGTC
jgi:hypothetical protein